MTAARFIVVEGIDGSGKSTLAAALARHLNARLLAEPTRGEFGTLARTRIASAEPLNPAEMLELFIRDRADDCARNIMPALHAGERVVMDRYYYSNAAYQGAMGLDPQAIIRRNRDEGFPEPDVLLLVDIDPQVALARVRARASTDDQFEKETFLSAVRRIFLALDHPQRIILDGARSPEDMFADAIAALGAAR
jgi:dTMP kinase